MNPFLILFNPNMFPSFFRLCVCLCLSQTLPPVPISLRLAGSHLFAQMTPPPPTSVCPFGSFPPPPQTPARRKQFPLPLHIFSFSIFGLSSSLSVPVWHLLVLPASFSAPALPSHGCLAWFATAVSPCAATKCCLHCRAGRGCSEGGGRKVL